LRTSTTRIDRSLNALRDELEQLASAPQGEIEPAGEPPEH
jgi:hypothetical protein